ncbi:hypothetical protein ABVK25_003384 [Lepraria finkii]|uniref:Uncharacterized protein n=1 Tax=Lepraria finkii TaxID=1340010 RepID=A0ABR4BH49_9LECA
MARCSSNLGRWEWMAAQISQTKSHRLSFTCVGQNTFTIAQASVLLTDHQSGVDHMERLFEISRIIQPIRRHLGSYPLTLRTRKFAFDMYVRSLIYFPSRPLVGSKPYSQTMIHFINPYARYGE